MRLWGNLSSCARPGGYPVYRRNWRVGNPPQAASWERWPEQWVVAVGEDASRVVLDMGAQGLGPVQGEAEGKHDGPAHLHAVQAADQAQDKD